MRVTRDIVGLDISPGTIRAVHARRPLMGGESITWYEERFPTGESDRSLGPGEDGSAQDERALRLRRFLDKHRLTGRPIVSAFPCRQTFLRTLSLPFEDRKKLGQIVPYEVESLLPVPLEDVTVDYHVFPPDRAEAQSEVLVAAAHKAAMREHLALLTDAGLSIRSVDLDSLSLSRVVHTLIDPRSAVGALAVIQIGQAATTVCLLHEGRPRLMRTLSWGLQQLAPSPAEDDPPPASRPERIRRSRSRREWAGSVATLVRDLRLSLAAFTAGTGLPVHHSWISGVGQEMQELAAQLEQDLGLMPMRDQFSHSLPCPPEFTVAYGLTLPSAGSWRPLAGTDAAAMPRLDFKEKTEAAEQPTVSRRSVGLAVGGALLLGLLAIGDLALHVWLKEARVRTAGEQVKIAFAQLFPGVPASGDELEQAQALVASAKKRLALLGGTQPPMLTRLADIQRLVPGHLALKIGALTVDNGAIQLEAETNSFESVEQLKEAMRAYPGTQDVAVSDARVGAAPNQVRFRLTVRLP